MGDLEDGKIYVLDWKESDPNDYNFGGKAEGTNYVQLDIPLRILSNATTKKESGGDNDFPGGATMILALGYWSSKYSISGIIQGTTQANTLVRQGYWEKFVYEEREDTELYLVICFGASTYWKFYDTDAGGVVSTCDGAFVDTDLQFKWVAGKSFAIEVTFTWKTNWG